MIFFEACINAGIGTPKPHLERAPSTSGGLQRSELMLLNQALNLNVKVS